MMEDGCMVCGAALTHPDWSHAFCSDLCHESWQVEQALAKPDYTPVSVDELDRTLAKALANFRTP